jgi:hypothetical protein
VSCAVFQPIDESRRAERPADGFGQADFGESVRRRSAIDEIGETAAAPLDDRRDGDQAIVRRRIFRLSAWPQWRLAFNVSLNTIRACNNMRGSPWRR